jgi:hypothetical protein
MSAIEILKQAFAKTSQGDWSVFPTLRTELDDDPMCEYVIESHQAQMTERYELADPESAGLEAIHDENLANAQFIMLAHNLMPVMLAELEHLQKLQGKLTDTGLMSVIRYLKSLYDEGYKNRWIAMAYHHFPEIAEEIERLQWLDAELDRVGQRANFFERTLKELLNTMSDMREQIEQMRGLFDDEDGAIQAACTEHDKASKMIGQVLTH